MREAVPSSSASRFVAQHGVQRWARNLREPSDLALAHARPDCHVGKPSDRFAFGLRLPARGCSSAAVLGEFGAELRERIVGHSCIVLDNRQRA